MTTVAEKVSQMKFIVSTTTLLKQLQLIGGIVSTNTVLPILEDFLFEIKDGKLSISSTDLETSMRVQVDVESKETMKVAIPAKIIIETLKTLPEQPLTFSIDEQSYGIEITSENGKYKLAGENGDDFPRIPVNENTSELELPAPVLHKAIEKTQSYRRHKHITCI